jgi:hypothetical protein
MTNARTSRLPLRLLLTISAALLLASACQDHSSKPENDASTSGDSAPACPDDCSVFCAAPNLYPQGCPCSCPATSGLCNAGCLCFTTPEACPTGCYPTTQQSDGASNFICANAPPPDGGLH